MAHLSMGHPGIADLLRYRFGEVNPPREKAVAAHLSACDACRLELHRLSAASAAVPSPGAADQRKLMSRLRAWQAAPATAERTGEALKRRVALEIAPYVGSRAADSILQPVVEDGGICSSSSAPAAADDVSRPPGHRTSGQPCCRARNCENLIGLDSHLRGCLSADLKPAIMPPLILLATGGYLAVGLVVFAAWRIAGNNVWIEDFFRVPGALLLCGWQPSGPCSARVFTGVFSPASRCAARGG